MPTTTDEISVGYRVRIVDAPRLAYHAAGGATGTVESLPTGRSQPYYRIRLDEPVPDGANPVQTLPRDEFEVVAELQVGDKVKVADDAGTRPRNDPYEGTTDRWGYVSPRLRGAEGTITGVDGHLFRVENGQVDQWVHSDFLTKVEEESKVEEFKLGDRVERTRAGSTMRGVVTRYRDLDFARADGSTNDTLVVRYEGDHGGWDYVRDLTPANGYTLTKVEEEGLADWEKELIEGAPAPAPADGVAKAVEDALNAYKVRVRETALRFGRINGINMEPLEDLLEEMGLNKLPAAERKIRRRVTVTFDLEATLSEEADAEAFDENESGFIQDSMVVDNIDLDSILDSDFKDVSVSNRRVEHRSIA